MHGGDEGNEIAKRETDIKPLTRERVAFDLQTSLLFNAKTS
jgi:hypothetical protein